jgi:hypothetical protein
MPNATLSDILECILTANKMLTDAFFQLSGRVDALKAVVCELHPEMCDRLEALISKEQSESLKQFAEIQQKIRISFSNLPKSVS